MTVMVMVMVMVMASWRSSVGCAHVMPGIISLLRHNFIDI